MNKIKDIVEVIPSLKEYIWRGTKLKEYKDKENKFKNISESFELSFLDEGPSLFYDETSNKVEELRKEVTVNDLGSNINNFKFNNKIYFPLLIKLIDSNDSLSIQVHPSDDYALKNENSLGKEIYVEDYTMFGANVVVATVGHPILLELRKKAYQYNIPGVIGRNCWLGAGVIVLPEVKIGDNTVTGAGSVV